MLLCRVVSISFVFSINSEYNHCFPSRCLFVLQSSLKTKKYSVLGKSCFYTVHSNTIASIYSEIPLYRSIPSGPNKMFNIRRDSQVIISRWISWFCTTAHVHHRGDSSIEGVRFRGVSLYWEYMLKATTWYMCIVMLTVQCSFNKAVCGLLMCSDISIIKVNFCWSIK